jgi:hypothetical protein
MVFVVKRYESTTFWFNIKIKPRHMIKKFFSTLRVRLNLVQDTRSGLVRWIEKIRLRGRRALEVCVIANPFVGCINI